MGKLPPPAGSDPRIDLIEAQIDKRLSNFPAELRAARLAEEKGRKSGESQVIAQALMLQGDGLLLAGRSREAIPLLRAGPRPLHQGGEPVRRGARSHPSRRGAQRAGAPRRGGGDVPGLPRHPAADRRRPERGDPAGQPGVRGAGPRRPAARPVAARAGPCRVHWRTATGCWRRRRSTRSAPCSWRAGISPEPASGSKRCSPPAGRRATASTRGGRSAIRAWSSSGWARSARPGGCRSRRTGSPSRSATRSAAPRCSPPRPRC